MPHQSRIPTRAPDVSDSLTTDVTETVWLADEAIWRSAEVEDHHGAVAVAGRIGRLQRPVHRMPTAGSLAAGDDTGHAQHEYRKSILLRPGPELALRQPIR